MIKMGKIINFLPKRYVSTLINGSFDKNDPNFIESKAKSFEILKKINEIKTKFLEGGGERARFRHVNQHNKLHVNDRLKLLFDNGKYMEFGFFVGYGQTYGDIPKAGAITALGYINDRLCCAIASDATVKGGVIFPIQLDKQLRIMKLAMSLHLPFIFVVDSGGAFLPLQSDIFPDSNHGGRIFYNQAVMQSQGIPVISLVCGSCTAGGAYIPTMSSENGMIHKSSFIFLGGPPLVKAATGEIVSAEDLGGANLHSKISGCSDYIFKTEADGFLSIRNTISNFPKPCFDSLFMESSADPLYRSDDLDGLLLNCCNNEENSRYIMNQILARILDSSSLHEYKSQYGTNLITGFSRIAGFSVGILACFGSLTEQDCIKGSNFIQLCGHRNITIVSIVHTVDHSISISDENQNDGTLLKAKSLMMRSISTRNCKMITMVVGDAVGLDYICLGGRSVEPDFLYAWITSRFGWTENDLKDEKISSALKAAGNMVVDEIIHPGESRSILKTLLQILYTKSNLLHQAHSMPVYRF